MFKWVIFVVMSAFLIYVSRASLRVPRSHGFYRFFAWECILVLFLLNVNFWFYDPFSWYHDVSWFLLVASLVPLVLGIFSLVTKGKPAKGRPDDEQLLAFEKTTRLVTTGVYHYIRHPLYSSLLLFAWGVFFKAPGWLGVLLVLVASLFLLATAKADEAECIRFFGPSYTAYMKKTKRFVPFLF
jgi:protein-S-isoprenylcysteine O-methyltransferase Ste14